MLTGFDIFAAVFATNVLPVGVAATGSHDFAGSRTALPRGMATTTACTAEDGTSEDSASLLPGSTAVRFQTLLGRAGSSPGAIDGISSGESKSQ